MTDDWSKTLTWRCDICRRERPDDKIDVHKVDLHPEQPGIVVRNVKYCNDTPECFEGAKAWQVNNRPQVP